jgi:hypothetical protein
MTKFDPSTNAFARIAAVAERKNARILVIGGHAINAYGYSRTTVDFDFVIEGTALPVWRDELEALGWDIVQGVANFALCHLPPNGPDAAAVVRQCRAAGLFLREAAAMGSRLGTHALRVAVKDAATNRRMIEIIREALAGLAGTPVMDSF